jgi:hypothetical protein
VMHMHKAWFSKWAARWHVAEVECHSTAMPAFLHARVHTAAPHVTWTERGAQGDVSYL